MTQHTSAMLHVKHVFSLLILLGMSISAFAGNIDSQKTFYVQDYISKSPGDIRQAFKNLSEDVNNNGGGKVLFPRKSSFYIDVPQSIYASSSPDHVVSIVVLNFKNCKNLEVDMNGCTIRVGRNHLVRYKILSISYCQSFYAHDGIIIGDADCHDYTSVKIKKTDNKTHEWGYGINLRGSCGTVRNMTVSNMTGDGIYAGSIKNDGVAYHSNLKIENCEVKYCRRNGITCVSSNGIVITGCKVHHIGTWKYPVVAGDSVQVTGTAPQAGIDFEFEDGVGDSGPIVLKDGQIDHCTSKVVTSAKNTKVVSYCVKDMTFSGSLFQIANIISNNKRVKNCTFRSVPIQMGTASVDRCSFVWSSQLSYVNGTRFNRCTFLGSLAPSTKNGCCLAGSDSKPCYFSRCTFKDIRGLNNTSASHQGFSGYQYTLNAEFHNCTFDNCSFVKGNPKMESSFTFEKCILRNGCMIYNEGGNEIEFKRSTLDNVSSYINQSGRFTFTRCKVIQDDESVMYPLLLYGTHKMKRVRISQRSYDSVKRKNLPLKISNQ